MRIRNGKDARASSNRRSVKREHIGRALRRMRRSKFVHQWMDHHTTFILREMASTKCLAHVNTTALFELMGLLQPNRKCKPLLRAQPFPVWFLTSSTFHCDKSATEENLWPKSASTCSFSYRPSPELPMEDFHSS